MFSAIFFIFGGSLVYVYLLKLTSGEHVSEEENNRRRISEKNIMNKKQLRDCSW